MVNFQKVKHMGIVTIPSLFTIGNITCGFFSILASVEGDFSFAGLLIFIAMLFDAFDGRVARMLHAESSFGVEMDSLADLISFCAAPAFLIYYIALRETPFGAPIAFIFMLFGAIRLAKFNVLANSGKGSKKHFSGLPTPAAAAVLVSLALSYDALSLDEVRRVLPIAKVYIPYIFSAVSFVTLGLALLMVSNIPYASFKSKPTGQNRKVTLGKFLFLAVLIILFIKYPQDIVFIVFGLYAMIGLIVAFVRKFMTLNSK